MSTYSEFLAAKRSKIAAVGPDVQITDINPTLHDWQREIALGYPNWPSGDLGRHRAG